MGSSRRCELAALVLRRHREAKLLATLHLTLRSIVSHVHKGGYEVDANDKQALLSAPCMCIGEGSDNVARESKALPMP